MLFNSIEYILFLPLVFLLYWWIQKEKFKLQNLLILIASYVFYGWWDYRFLSLVIISTCLDYFIGLQLNQQQEKHIRKRWLLLSIIGNLSILVGFKYFNFFTDSFIALLSLFGMEADPITLNIILPIGISFYTFQTMSYTIDVYERRMKPTSSWVSFACYVAFFPQLVAGPIERARNLLPQFHKPRAFDYRQAIDGLRQILWGFFKKIVIADNLLIYYQHLYYEPGLHDGSFILFLCLMSSIMIYADFSGYSDIAIGSARLFGFKLQQNFAFPFFSRTMTEFWKRWHKSLFGWLLYYVYRPLQGNKENRSESKTRRNLLIIFILSGFWHGAAWGFIIWGILHSLILILERIMEWDKKIVGFPEKYKKLPHTKDMLGFIYTSSIFFSIGIFFNDIPMFRFIEIIQDIFIGILNNPLEQINHLGMSQVEMALVFLYLGFMFMMEWFNRNHLHGLEQIHHNKVIRWSIYLLLSLSIIEYFGTAKTFVYYQF